MKLPEEDLPIDHEIIPPMTRSLGDRSHETITGVPPQSEYIKSRSSNDGSNLRPNLNKEMKGLRKTLRIFKSNKISFKHFVIQFQ